MTANDVAYTPQEQWDEEDEETTGEITEVTPPSSGQ